MATKTRRTRKQKPRDINAEVTDRIVAPLEQGGCPLGLPVA